MFGPYGLVDIPPDCLYIRTIPLSVWTDMVSRYTPFITKHNCKFGRTPLGVIITPGIIPLGYPAGYHQGPEPFQANELSGAPTRQRQYPPRTGRIITYVYIKYFSHRFILHNILKTEHGLFRILKYIWWLPLARPTKVKLPASFGVYRFMVRFCWR